MLPTYLVYQNLFCGTFICLSSVWHLDLKLGCHCWTGKRVAEINIFITSFNELSTDKRYRKSLKYKKNHNILVIKMNWYTWSLLHILFFFIKFLPVVYFCFVTYWIHSDLFWSFPLILTCIYMWSVLYSRTKQSRLLILNDFDVNDVII